jgi:hypothetical protein
MQRLQETLGALFFLPLLLACALLSSCVAPSRSEERTEPAPDYKIWVRYLPHTDQEAQFRLGVRPVPMDNGWTDLRMQRDLQRIYFAEISAVMVEVSPEELLQESFQARLRRFGELANEYQLKILLSVVQSQPESPQTLDRKNLADFLGRLALPQIPAYFLQEDGKAVVLIHETFGVADPSSEAPEAIAILRFGKELPAYRPQSPQDPTLRYQWACGGIVPGPGDLRWNLPRKRGNTLVKQLKALRGSPIEILLLSSWNDYSEGSFLENNSLDGNALTSALKMR